MWELFQSILGIYVVPALIVYLISIFKNWRVNGVLSEKDKRLIFTPVINLFAVAMYMLIGMFSVFNWIFEYYFDDRK